MRLAVMQVASFSLLILAVVAAMVLSSLAAAAEGWVRHTLDVRRLNQALFATVQDATLGERGYLITQDPRYLAQFHAAKAEVPELELRLQALVYDNAAARQRVARLSQAIGAQVAELDRTVGLLERGHAEQAIAAVRSHLVVNHMNEVRARSAAVDDGEVRLLASREKQASVRRVLLVAAMGTSLAASVLLALFVLTASRRSMAELAQRRDALAEEMRRREATEGQLRQAQKMEALGQLTGGIAHDFNNMLAIIIGNLDMLLRRLSDDEARRRLVEQALEGAQRATRLTQSLLAFSRQQPLEPRSLDVNKTVAEMSRLFRSTLGEGVTIETVLAGGLWPALIDRVQLESAVLNLAINARDAMPKGGKLTIETANAFLDEAYARADGTVAAGQYVLLALTDTGGGMTADVIAKAFDPFFTTKAVGQGTGLGLSQVHGFVKQSGGHVKIYSEPDKGTTVKLYLPRSRLPADAGSAAVEPPPQEAPSGLWVLVVEDEAGVREFVCSALRDLGYRTHEAPGGQAALAVLESDADVALLLTDVVMPDMHGRALADQALTLRPDLKVLFMTGYTRNAIVHNGVLDANARLLTKPFTLSNLASKISEALAER